MYDIVIFLSFLLLGYLVGTFNERRHYKSINSREDYFLKNPAVTFDKAYDVGKVKSATLVTGSAVMSVDYFKRIVASLRNLVGGRVSSYETLVDRARREAFLRMRESMPNADMIINVRIETSAIGRSAKKKKTVASIEAFAYGTALMFN